MDPNKLGSAAPGGGVEKTGNFTAEQNPVKNFEVEKNSEKPKTGAEIFELKMSQIANRREMIEQMKADGKLGFDDYKTKKQALDLVENKLTKLYDIYENREVNEAEREKELELRNEQFEESKDFLRRLSQDKELPRAEKMKLMERFSQRLVDCHDKVEKVKKAREMDERVYQLFGGKSGEEKAEGETKEKTEKKTEGKTEDKTELKTEEKSEISVEDSAKTNESKTSVENEASEKKEKKPTKTFSWNGGVGGPMFFPGGSASTVKVNKTTENGTTDGIKTEALNVVQKEALRQAEEKFFYENLKTLGGAMAADGYKEMYYESFLRPLKKPEAGSPELASFDERNKLHNESIEKMKAFESKFNLDKIKADVGRAISSNAKLEFGIGLYRIDASRNELQNIIDDKRSSEEEKQKAMEELAMLDQVKEGFLENIGSHQGERYSNEEYASVPENEKKNANRYLFLQKVRQEMKNPINILRANLRIKFGNKDKNKGKG
jgi:hypothetical protein